MVSTRKYLSFRLSFLQREISQKYTFKIYHIIFSTTKEQTHKSHQRRKLSNATARSTFSANIED